jgi:hypothetical protein
LVVRVWVTDVSAEFVVTSLVLVGFAARLAITDR